MIYRNGKEITAVQLGAKAMAAIYKGAVLVWQLVSSCFGGGYWQKKLPWTNKEGWLE